MTVAAAIEIGTGGHSEPGQGSAPGRVAGVTALSALTVTPLGSSVTSIRPGPQSFRSNWQTQMAVLSHEMDGEMGGPDAVTGAAEGATDAAGEGTAAPGTPWTRSGSALSIKTSGMQKSLSPPPVSRFTAAVTVGSAGMARSRIGGRDSSPVQASVVASVGTPAASGNSAKTANAGLGDRPDEAKAVPTAKPPKQMELAATSLSPEASGFFTVAPLMAVVQPAAKISPAAEPSLPADPFSAPTQSNSFFNSQLAGSEPGMIAETANQSDSNPVEIELKQTHDEFTLSDSNKITLVETFSKEEAESALPLEGRGGTGGNQWQSQSGAVESQAAPTPVQGQETNHIAVHGNPAGAQTGSAPVPAQISPDQKATNAGSAPIPAAKQATRSTDAAGVSAIAPQAQSAVIGGETGSMVRDLTGVPAGASAAVSSHAISSSPSMPETFAALDAAQAPGSITWTHAGARQAEAGFEDPTLGWVGVRADLNGGVHATLLPGSVEAAQALGPHMEGLSAYMAQQHMPVESLALAAPENRGANQSTGQSFSQGTNQEMGQSTGSGTGQGTGQGAGQGAGGNAQTHTPAEPESRTMSQPGRGWRHGVRR